MKLLFVLASPEYLRFFDSTITLLARRGHQVHLVANEAAEYKPVGLEGAGTLPLAGVTVIPPPRTFWGDTACAYRAVVDFARFLHPDFSAASVLRERIRKKVLPRACQWLNWIPRLPVTVLNGLLAVMRLGEQALPVDPRVAEYIAASRPDLIVVSPLVDAASAQVDWIKAAADRGIPSAVAVASWDNLTNKGLMRALPERVFLWNEIQRHEATAYHAVPPDSVVATGAPVFDRWFDREPARDRAAFCAAAGLPDARPFVLFAGSSSFIADAEREVAFVRRWIAALRASSDPALRGLRVLARPHPYNTGAWAPASLGDAAASVWPRGAFNPASEAGRADFFDSLYHSSAVVGINTSAMIEASIVGRPVLTITEFETQGGTLHFRYLLAENGGPVIHANTVDQHLAQLATALREPRAADSFVRSFIRPQGLDAPSTPTLAAAIEDAAQIRVKRRAAFTVLLRPAMAAFGVWVALVDRLTSGDPFVPVRKGVLHPVRNARRRLVRAASHRRERAARSARLAANRLRRANHVARARIRSAPALWKRWRRAMRHARYAIGTYRKGGESAR